MSQPAEHRASSRGRDVLSIPDSPEALLTAIKSAVPVKYNVKLRFRSLIGLSNACQTPLAFF